MTNSVDLSTNPEGPYVTRDGRKATYVPTPKPIVLGYPFTFDVEGIGELRAYAANGLYRSSEGHDLDLIPAPVEPEKRYLNWGPNNETGIVRKDVATARCWLGPGYVTLELSVDEHGIPIDGSVVKRVES